MSGPGRGTTFFPFLSIFVNFQEMCVVCLEAGSFKGAAAMVPCHVAGLTQPVAYRRVCIAAKNGIRTKVPDDADFRVSAMLAPMTDSPLQNTHFMHQLSCREAYQILIDFKDQSMISLAVGWQVASAFVCNIIFAILDSWLLIIVAIAGICKGSEIGVEFEILFL